MIKYICIWHNCFLNELYKRIKSVWKFPKARQTPLMLNHKRMLKGKKRHVRVSQTVISERKLPFHQSQMTSEVAVQSNCFLAYYKNNNKTLPVRREGESESNDYERPTASLLFEPHGLFQQFQAKKKT